MTQVQALNPIAAYHQCVAMQQEAATAAVDLLEQGVRVWTSVMFRLVVPSCIEATSRMLSPRL